MSRVILPPSTTISLVMYLPFKGKDTDNIDFCCRKYLIDYLLIDLIITLYDIHFLERQGIRKEQINSRAEGDK